MNWSRRIRDLHRWISIAFVAAVILTTVALAQKSPLAWAAYLPLAPLALLTLSGLYLFVLPYVARRQGRDTAHRDSAP